MFECNNVVDYLKYLIASVLNGLYIVCQDIVVTVEYALYWVMYSLNMCNKLLAIGVLAVHAVITPTYRPESSKEERVVD